MAKTDKPPQRYLQIVKTGQIVRCICCNDKTATIELPKGQAAQIRFNQVVSPPVEEVQKFLARESRE